MSGIAFRYQVETAIDALARAAASLDKPSELWRAIGEVLVDSTQERFEKEQDPQGNPWPQSLRALVEGGKTLRDTQRLFRSITQEAGGTSVAVGTNVEYAGTHQTGGTIRAKTKRGLRFRRYGAEADTIVKSVTIPRRAFLGLDDGDRQEIIALADEFIADALGSGGGQ